MNFSAASYRANFNASSVIVRVMAFGSFASPFLVEVIPFTDDVPEGTYITQCNCIWGLQSINFSGNRLFFNADPREVLFTRGVEIGLVPIQLFPEEFGDMDLQFNVRLVVPVAARSQGVVLGEPSVATVTVPAIR